MTDDEIEFTPAHIARELIAGDAKKVSTPAVSTLRGEGDLGTDELTLSAVAYELASDIEGAKKFKLYTTYTWLIDPENFFYVNVK